MVAADSSETFLTMYQILRRQNANLANLQLVLAIFYYIVDGKKAQRYITSAFAHCHIPDLHD
jgi:hypothetical protein